jgi:hypothetical protein
MSHFLVISAHSQSHYAKTVHSSKQGFRAFTILWVWAVPKSINDTRKIWRNPET